jgi:predicted restriction endonuclease
VFGKFSKESLQARSAAGADARALKAREKLMSCDIITLTPGARRKRVLIEQDYKCSECGLTDWLGNTISLEMDHIDGNKQNNSRDNLTCLCPNCHAQTPTGRGRRRI